MANAEKKYVVAATWSFSLPAVSKCADALLRDSRGIDALVSGINESDESYGSCHVGRGGPRNAAGQLEQDAAVMEGENLKFGAVTALQGIPNAISVAKKVLETSKHSMLTAEGAQKFATDNGFNVDPFLIDSRDESKQGNPAPNGHDTVGILVRGADGTFYAGVSTSGAAGKHPGRVGDSALPGCGLYADNLGGAACCSGDGDQILKYCPAFHIVHLMKQNIPAHKACQQVVKEIMKRSEKEPFEMVVIAIDRENNIGAASTIGNWVDPMTRESYAGFPYVCWSDEMGSREPTVKLQKQESQ